MADGGRSSSSKVHAQLLCARWVAARVLYGDSDGGWDPRTCRISPAPCAGPRAKPRRRERAAVPSSRCVCVCGASCAAGRRECVEVVVCEERRAEAN